MVYAKEKWMEKTNHEYEIPLPAAATDIRISSHAQACFGARHQQMRENIANAGAKCPEVQAMAGTQNISG